MAAPPPGALAGAPLYSFGASQEADDPAPPDFSFLEFTSQQPAPHGSLGDFDYADFSAPGSQSQSQSQAASAAGSAALAFEEPVEDERAAAGLADQPRQLPEHACRCEP